MSAIWAVQKAIAARLQESAALVARVSGVFDGQAPEGVALPYVVIRNPTEEPAGVFGPAFDVWFYLSIWSGQRGSSREAYEVADLVHEALRAPFSAPGWRKIIASYDQADLLIESDGTRHLPLRYRFAAYREAA